MRTYLKLEVKLGPKPRQQPQPQQYKNQPRLIQPSLNPLIRRGTKTNDKRRKLIPTRQYKVQLVAKPVQAPTPKADNVTTQMPVTIPITMMNVAKGQFQENPPKEVLQLIILHHLENIPPRAGTPWPETWLTSDNLFEARKDWPIPPTPTSTPTIKVEAQPNNTVIPHATVAPKQIKQKWRWGLNCPICKKI